MNTKLDQEVLDLLKTRKGDWPAVVSASGVSYSWLSKFVNGHITNPGYATLIRLHAVLQPPVTGSVPPTPKPVVPVASLDLDHSEQERRAAERREELDRRDEERRMREQRALDERRGFQDQPTTQGV